ncbi:MAG: hypothetical protein HYX66_09870 [Ignavibacteria bacterium]|nr:hypothetical protein [Ignavibacteria bacterium]
MMQRILAGCIIILSATCLRTQTYWNPLEVDITRSITNDLFESNAVPYVQPMVTAINATSNARFYNTAFIPESVEQPYFRVSINGMLGFVREDMRWYKPDIDFGPRINVPQAMADYGTIRLVNGKFVYQIKPTYQDTLGLSEALVKELLRDALDSSYFVLPDSAATLFGYVPDNRVGLPNNQQLLVILHGRAEYKILDSAAKAALDTLIGGMTLPPYLTLPPGVNLNAIIAAVPQLEIGSLWGTEALIRFIPPVEFDPNIGEFSFWGLGLKHSLSQYFPERWFDLAVQVSYQGTNLRNTVGFTESKLEANANIFSSNVQMSKEIEQVLNFYTGFNYERINVISTYTYVLPQEVQIALGLLPKPPEGKQAVPTPEQPGDQVQQKSIVKVNNVNLKWTIGSSLHLGNFWLAIDYSVSQFNILSFGIAYTL